jgi:hypothetical protein
MTRRNVPIGTTFSLRGKVGTKIEGIYLGHKAVKSDFERPNIVHKIKTPDGKEVEFFGFTSVNLRLQNVQIGDYIYVEYLGLQDETKKPGRTNQHLSKVEIDDEKREEVAF